MTGMVQTDLAHPPAPKYKDEPVEDPVSVFSHHFLSARNQCFFCLLCCSFLSQYFLFPFSDLSILVFCLSCLHQSMPLPSSKVNLAYCA